MGERVGQGYTREERVPGIRSMVVCLVCLRNSKETKQLSGVKDKEVADKETSEVKGRVWHVQEGLCKYIGFCRKRKGIHCRILSRSWT